ncbi:MAG: transposase [Rhizobiaceae bacterium]|nr:transposase [Rhizobiaceae bacterium]
MRDDLLNEPLLFGLTHAKQEIEGWVDDYNNQQPNSALSYQTPVAYVAKFNSVEAIAKLELTAPYDVSRALAQKQAG